MQLHPLIISASSLADDCARQRSYKMRLPYRGDPHPWGLLYFQTLGAEPLPGGTWENYHLGPYLPESLCALQDFVQRVEKDLAGLWSVRV